MPQKTPIEWTDYSSQLIRYRDAAGKDVWACAKTSPGCARCYSEAIAERFGRGGPFNLATVRATTPYFAHDEATKVIRSKPLSGRRVFVGDMTDVFGEWVPDDLLDRMFAVFALRHDVTFQVLTKRPERMARYFNDRDSHLAMTRQFVNFREYAEPVGPWPLPNVHLGTSVEDQARANERIPHLLNTPAAVRFLSVEPLLGDVNLTNCLYGEAYGSTAGKRGGPGGQMVTSAPPPVSWVIVGGESGKGARPCDVGWIRSVVNQCREADVPCFVKQLGARPFGNYGEPCAPVGRRHMSVAQRQGLLACSFMKFRDSKGGDPSEWPEALRVREFPMPRAMAST
jgi:protein gp37